MCCYTDLSETKASKNKEHATPKEELWGLATSVDIKDCDPELIRSAEAVKRFTRELVDLIKMKPFGECHVVHFGTEDRISGFSMFQLIDTSCVSAHFANATNAIYLDVFSCKLYDPKDVAEFAIKFFKGSCYTLHVTKRY